MSLLPKSHRIVERPLMEFRPFGKDSQGVTIQDVSGIAIRANLEYLEEAIQQHQGPEAAKEALHTLVALLNERIPDRTYHVTVDFLKNHWNSYSYEFAMFLAEFSVQLSHEENFHFNLGREKFLSPIIQILGRPFSIAQIYRLFPHFVEKFTKGSLKPEVLSVTNGHAVMRLQLSESTIRQFGPYLQGCAERICHTTKATVAEVPARMFGKRAASIQDRSCIAEGAPHCEWAFTWEPERRTMRGWILGGLALGLATIVALRVLAHDQPWWVIAGLSLLPLLILPLAKRLWDDRLEIQERGKIIQEQLEAAEQRHEELREAYLAQEHTLIEIRRRVDELTMLHQLTLHIGSTLDRETIIGSGLKAIVGSLSFDHAWAAVWDASHQHFHKIQSEGMSEQWTALVQDSHIPSAPRDLLHKTLHTQEPLVIEDITDFLSLCHPTTQQILVEAGTKSGFLLPLISQNQLLGVLIVGSTHQKAIPIAEQNLLSTVAHEMAIALDTAIAYDEIEALNIGLEHKVQERTLALQQANTDLEAANHRLKELDRMKSQFLSHCSHELRTPLTSIKGFTENLLHGMLGPLAERQHLYLTRISANANRLTRMIADLLDLSRIEAGTVLLAQGSVSLSELLENVTQELLPLTQTKAQHLTVELTEDHLTAWGDQDRLHQIVTNLVHNAHKFSPQEGRILVKASPAPPGHILLTISDTGPGIPREAQVSLFQPFFQAHRIPEIGTQGLGLGLSIVKQLVELHGGTISVESQPGEGATFHIRLPAVCPSTLSPSAQASHEPQI
ncbi:GAF domain-containing sensor histidine kinase [Nitrospira sp. T9]|uniref:sensor histidine kinase n=1 Tax=unclassified Nitrospira TaxID=2652172 RepID=UPI003F9B1E95